MCNHQTQTHTHTSLSLPPSLPLPPPSSSCSAWMKSTPHTNSNQIWYARKGFPEAGGYPCGSTPPPPPVSDYVDLRVKATPESEWETVGLDSTLRGIVVLNLQSYGGKCHVTLSCTRLYQKRCVKSFLARSRDCDTAVNQSHRRRGRRGWVPSFEYSLDRLYLFVRTVPSVGLV